MHILIAGASGLIGSALKATLIKQGHRVSTLSRSASDGSILWNPATQEIDLSSLEPLDVCINLAGENIAARRWSAAQKELIRKSRTDAVQTLLKGFSQLKQAPHSYLCASAVGFYGNRGDTLLNESSSAGNGFLSETVVAWENAAMAAQTLNIRTVLCRFGVVLSPQGGALQKMLPVFKLGLGGKIADGNQYMSWISIDDATSAITYLMNATAINGAVNVTSPNPLTNREFSETLAHTLHRPCFCSVPRFALKAATGEMGEALLLSSAKVIPQKLLESDFEFKHTILDQALSELLNKR